jgi:hypothetical protein
MLAALVVADIISTELRSSPADGDHFRRKTSIEMGILYVYRFGTNASCDWLDATVHVVG